jgi:hypothetical protein
MSRDGPWSLLDDIEFWCFEALGALNAYAMPYYSTEKRIMASTSTVRLSMYAMAEALM